MNLALGRLTETRLRNAAGTLLNRHDYACNGGNQRTRQTRTGGDYVDYAYDATGQLLAATGRESGGTTNRAHEKMGYLFDAVGNLICRTNNAHVQTFRVNKLNQPTNAIRSGTFTVTGHTLSPASSVTAMNFTRQPLQEACQRK